MSVYIKKIKGTLSGLRHCLTTESSLKMNKKAFYFTMKVLFVLKIFRFLSQPFGFVEKQLDQKDKISKFMTSEPDQKTIAIHILLNI